MKLYELTASEASELLRSREISSVELTTSLLNRIDALDNRIHAYLTLNRDQALEAARRADQELDAARQDSAPARPLLGIPMSIKDVISTKGVRT
ncbi:MAG: amidase family protein, partial [Rudaea sp.]